MIQCPAATSCPKKILEERARDAISLLAVLPDQPQALRRKPPAGREWLLPRGTAFPDQQLCTSLLARSGRW